MNLKRFELSLVFAAFFLVLVSCATPAAPVNPAPQPATAATAAPTAPPATSEPTLVPSPSPAPPTATEPVSPTLSATATATEAPATATTSAPTTQPTSIESTPSGATETAQAPEGEATATEEASGSTGGFDFLPAGEGRELLLSNCVNCHSFVCAVIGQRTKGHLESIKDTHRDRVSGLTEEQLDTLFTYLYDNFGDQKPEPELPEELKGLGCSAQ